MLPHPPILIPAIGRGEEGRLEKTASAYREAAERIRRMEPETLVLLSPHQTMYADYFHISPGDGGQGGILARSGRGKKRWRSSTTRSLCGSSAGRQTRRGLRRERWGERERSLDHGTMVPLLFINPRGGGCRLVRIGLSGLPLAMHYELGKCIRETAERLGRRIVASPAGICPIG